MCIWCILITLAPHSPHPCAQTSLNLSSFMSLLFMPALFNNSPRPVNAGCMPMNVGQTLEHGNPTSSHTLKKIDSSRSPQLPITLQQGMGLHEPVRDGLLVAWSCVGIHSCCVLMTVMATSCLEGDSPSWDLIFYSLLWCFLSSGTREWALTTYVLSTLTSSDSLHWLPPTAVRGFSKEGWVQH